MYEVDRTIKIQRADTVVLGLGLATLTAVNGVEPMSVAGVAGVDIAGVMFDAGRITSPVLLRVGPRPGRRGHGRGHGGSSPGDPTAQHDVFFRIGGPYVGKATVSLEVNSNDVILDDIWAWRADHGSGVGWTVNTTDSGRRRQRERRDRDRTRRRALSKIRGDLAGERGRTVMFQNEMPYDAPNQGAWRDGAALGYAAYVVANSVRTHEAWGLGSYIYTNVDPKLHASRAFSVPSTVGVRMHDLLTISLDRAGTIDHVVDDTGGPVTPTFPGPSTVGTYP